MSVKNNKRKIVILIGVIIILLICTISMLLIFKNDEEKEYLYGTFEYTDEDGDKSVIRLEKNSAYIENADYENCEKFSAQSMLWEQEDENDLIEDEEDMDPGINKAEKEKKIKEICDNVDFKELFDKKTNKIEINDGEYELGRYLCIVTANEDEENKILITVDYKNKICSLLGKPKVKYTYIS